jgi:Xaa-Pro aminopeptidase
VLREGDLAWIDMGAVHDNYCSDITRTFPVGTPDDELQQIYRVVYRAQKEAREKTRPGMTAGEVDSICRDVITATGYGEYFIHRTGHGLGLDVHEEPYIVQTSKLVLEPGMVFTIEPGVYLPGKGGVRIEDDVVVTDKGVESLTSYRRDWLSS